MLRTYLVTSPFSCGWELRAKEGISSFSPPVGFGTIATVTVLVELVCIDDVGVTSAFGVVLLAFMGDVLDVPVAEVA